MTNDDNESPWSFNPQLPTVTGFLGALTFTALILIMQFSSDIKFSEILISITATVSFLFIIVTLGGAIDQRNSHLITKPFIRFVLVCYTIAIFGMFVILPLLVYSFSLMGTIILIMIEIITVLFWLKYTPQISFKDI